MSTWIGGAHINAEQVSGDPNAWDNPLNWIGGIPGASSTAAFTNDVDFTLPDQNPLNPPVAFHHPFTVLVNENINTSVASISIDSTFNGQFNVSGKTLSVTNGISQASTAVNVTNSGQVVLSGSSTWTGGSMNSDGSPSNVVNNGTLSVPGSTSVGLSLIGASPISGSFTPLVNNGTLKITGSGGVFLKGTVLVNAASGVIDLQSTGGINDFGIFFNQGFYSGSAFVNDGLVKKTVGTGAASISSEFDSSAKVDVEMGTLSLQSKGTLTGGDFTVATGATFDLSGTGASITVDGVFTGSGGGRVIVAGPSGSLLVGDATHAGATFNFPSGFFQFIGNGGYPLIQGNSTGGAATLTNLGFVTIDTSGGSISSPFGSLILDNKGTITQTGGNGFGIATINIVNEAGATYDIQSDGTIFTGAGTFTNKGLLKKSAGTGISTILAPLVNDGGTIEADTGTLLMGGTSTYLNASQFQASSGATISLVGASVCTVTGTLTGTGAGRVVVTGSSSGSLLVGDATHAGATFNFPSGFFQFIGNGGYPLIQGNSTGGAATLTNLGFVTIDTSGGSISSPFGSLILDNKGTITQTGGNGLLSITHINIVNEAGATYDIQSDGTIFTGAGPFTNKGLLKKSAGTGISTNIANFVNDGGTIQVDTGTFSVGATGYKNTSTFRVASGASVILVSNNTACTMTGTLTGTGGGQVVINNSTLQTGVGGATFNFPANFLQWQSSTITAQQGPLTIASGSFLTLVGATSEAFIGTVDVLGTITVNGTGALNLVTGGLTIEPGALFDIQADGTTTSGGTFTNKGIIRKSAGAGTSSLTSTTSSLGTTRVDSGTLTIPSLTGQISSGALGSGTWVITHGAMLNLNSNTALTINNASVTLDGAASTFTNFANKLATNNGSFSLQNGAAFFTPGNFANSGSLVVSANSTFTSNGTTANSGTITIGGELNSTGNYNQSAGSTVLTGGTLDPIAVNFNGGTLSGSGAIVGNVSNAAVVSPGGDGAAGKIAITGTYTQTSPGALDTELGGIAPGTQFDQLAVSGLATLDGTLKVSLINGWAPAVSDDYPILTYGSHTGDFATKTGLQQGNVPLSPNFHDAAPTPNLSLTATKAQATLSLSGLVFTFDGSPHTATVITNPAVLNGFSVTYTRNGVAVASPTIAGSYSVVATLDNPFFSAANAIGTLVINAATPSITWANPAAIVYGSPLGATQLNATASLGGANVTGTFTYAPGAGSVLNAGAGQALSVSFTPADANDYQTVSATAHIDVAPAPLTVTADNATQFVGSSDPAFTSHIVGFVHGEGPKDLGGVLTFTSIANSHSPAGLYTITPGGLTSSNYEITFAKGTLTVTPIPTPPVTVLGVQWQTRKVSKRKTINVLLVSYSEALDAGQAQDVSAYRLVAAGKDKKFGTHDDKPTKLASVLYDAGTHSVTLTPMGKLSSPIPSMQLSITSAKVRGADHRSLDGNRDGQPGDDFVAILGRQGFHATVATASQSGVSSRISTEAIDALLVTGHFPRTRDRRPGR